MAKARDDSKAKAKWCEHAERYDDMVNEMKEVIKASTKENPMDEEERNLLSVAYKNVVGSRRSSWRVINSKIADDMKDNQRKVCEAMKTRVEEELKALCNDVLKLLNDHLIPKAENDQAKIFFLKMKGDYQRYIIEISGEGPSREELTKKAEEAYQDAMDIAKEKLSPNSPIRLGLALNYSVFFYEIKNSPDEACNLAKTAFDDALPDIDEIPEDVYKDSTLIMQLLRDNLTLWNSEREEGPDDDNVEEL